MLNVSFFIIFYRPFFECVRLFLIAFHNNVKNKIVSDTFKRSPVFRIGGDEFCVILQNKDLADKNELFASLESQCATTYIDNDNLKIPVSVAKGFSTFDGKTDSKFLDVFERADNEMYTNKRKMKSSTH